MLERNRADRAYKLVMHDCFWHSLIYDESALIPHNFWWAMSAIVQTLSCPVCQNISDFTAYESINVGDHPALLGPLLRNELFVLSCSACGTITPIAYDTLYHDPGCRLMVWLIQDDQEQPPEPPRISCSRDYTLRRVFTSEELIEKAQLARDRIDDRIMELFKLTLAARLIKDTPDLMGTLHYAGRIGAVDDQFFFRITTVTGSTGAAVSIQEFAAFAAACQALPENELNWSVIDHSWAQRQLQLR